MNEENIAKRPVIVCLHGSASNSNMWDELRSEVRGRATVITPDLAGIGKRALADDVASVLRQIGVTRKPFHIVAHSRGAAIAACIASLYPERVASLVCYEPAGVSPFVARSLDVPFQLLCGTRSWQVARRVAEKTAELVSHARLLKLVGLRHMAPVTHPHVFNPIVLDFILPVSMPDQARAA
jgi:pimeloyl-ACP methyl ester carboxylesterase